MTSGRLWGRIMFIYSRMLNIRRRRRRRRRRNRPEASSSSSSSSRSFGHLLSCLHWSITHCFLFWVLQHVSHTQQRTKSKGTDQISSILFESDGMGWDRIGSDSIGFKLGWIGFNRIQIGLDQIQLDSIGLDGIGFPRPKDISVVCLLLGLDQMGVIQADIECLFAGQMPPIRLLCCLSASSIIHCLRSYTTSSSLSNPRLRSWLNGDKVNITCLFGS